jgi:uncharacterized protein
MKLLNILAFILVVIGALNWGLWGFFQFDLVAWLFKGNTTWLSRLIYAIIGVAGVWTLRFMCKNKCCCTCCHSSESTPKSTGKGGGCCKM